LYDRKLPSGNILYISGAFQSFKDAIEAKNEIVNKGVKDAFVVAYNDGKELTIYEARNLAANNAAPVVNTAAANTNLTTTASTDKTGIEFKVQLGAFTKDVPAEVVNQLLDLVAKNGLEHTKNDEGLTVYTTGNFKDFSSANELKASLIEKGIKDAFVTAYQHGNRITVTKAIELLK
jgi:acyl CoA:acetate/3-ketoacid CoA transferase alpha subunit